MAYNRNGRGAQRRSNNNRFNGKNNRGTYRDILREKNPESFDIGSLISNSASLKRHVSLGLIAQYRKNGRIQDDQSCYIEFGLTKYTIKINGLGEDKYYSEPELLKALLAASISINAQIQDLTNAICCANFNEPLKEVSILSSEDAINEIQSIAEDVIDHIKDKLISDAKEQ